jgi:hypothetical protein
VTVLCVVTGDEIIRGCAFQRIRFQREMLVGTEVVYPDLFRPWLLACWLTRDQEPYSVLLI